MILDLPYDLIHLIINEHNTMANNIALLRSCKYLYNTFINQLQKLSFVRKDLVFYDSNDTYKQYLNKKQFVIDNEININTTYEFKLNYLINVYHVAQTIPLSKTNLIAVQKAKLAVQIYRSIDNINNPFKNTKMNDTINGRRRISLAFKSHYAHITTPIIVMLKSSGICTVYNCNYEELVNIMRRMVRLLKQCHIESLKIIDINVNKSIITKSYKEYDTGIYAQDARSCYLYHMYKELCPNEYKGLYFFVDYDNKPKEKPFIDIYHWESVVRFFNVKNINDLIKLYKVFTKFMNIVWQNNKKID